MDECVFCGEEIHPDDLVETDEGPAHGECVEDVEDLLDEDEDGDWDDFEDEDTLADEEDLEDLDDELCG